MRQRALVMVLVLLTGGANLHADGLIGGFDDRSKKVTLVVIGASAALLMSEDVGRIEDVGDVLQIGLPLAALGASYKARDREGRRAFLSSIGTSTVTVRLLKEIVDKARPNAQGLNSFPSGHTASAFSGASFINLRYGARWGAPSLVLAAYTGASRVRAQKHFLDDVISGMSISLLANRFFAFPIDEELEVIPLVEDDAAGLMVSWRGSMRQWRDRSFDAAPLPQRGFRYQWEFGGTGVERNVFGTPGGSDFSFLFDEDNNPTVTARIELGYTPRERQEVVFQLAPFEVRDRGRFATDTVVGSTLVPGGEPLETQFLLYDSRLRYRFLMRPLKRVRLHVGGGVSFQDIVAGLRWAGGEARVEEGNFIPFAHLDSEILIGDRLRLTVEADVGRSAEDRLSDTAMALRYEIHPRWDLSGGLRRIERTVVTDVLRNELERNQVVISLAYSF